VIADHLLSGFRSGQKWQNCLTRCGGKQRNLHKISERRFALQLTRKRVFFVILSWRRRGFLEVQRFLSCEARAALPASKTSQINVV